MPVRTLVALMLAASLGAAAPGPVGVQDHEGHAGALALNHGAKWTSDAPLRQGMATLRSAVEAPPRELADVIEVQVAYIIENCRLPADADANLHLVIEQLIEGAERLRVGDGSEGRAQVVAALNAYGSHFDHPGWRPILP